MGEGTWSAIGEIPKVDFKNEVKKLKNRGSGRSEETPVSDKDFNDLLDMAQDNAGDFRKEGGEEGYSESSSGGGGSSSTGDTIWSISGYSTYDSKTGQRTIGIKGYTNDMMHKTMKTLTYDKNGKQIQQKTDTIK